MFVLLVIPLAAILAVNYFAVDENDQQSPLFTEPYWGGYYGKEPYVLVYQVSLLE